MQPIEPTSANATRHGSGASAEFKATAGIVAPIVAAVTLAGLGAVLYAYDPGRYGFYPRCPLYEWTHLQCAGCGTLRAAHALLHGDLGAALRFNALATLGAPAAAWVALGWLLRRLAGLRLPLTHLPPRAVAVGGILAVVYSVARNVVHH